MLSGGNGDSIKRCNTQSFETYKEALDCKNELEKSTKQPYHTTFIVAGVPVRVESGYQVNCADGVTYDSDFVKSGLVARECAESLTLITGTKHVVTTITSKNLLEKPAYKVTKAEPEKK